MGRAGSHGAARVTARRVSARRVTVCMLLFLGVTALAPGVTLAQDCIDYRDYLHWVGGVDLGSCSGVAVTGTHAYVTDGDIGLPGLWQPV